VEDEDIAKVLAREDLDGLRAIIPGRDETQGTWGFKLPMLDRDLGVNAFATFRDPHVILMFRDPAAVVVRGALSDYDEPMERLREAVAEQAALVAFADRLRCPLLVLSYEKALTFPDACVDAQKHPARRQSIDRRHRRGLHRGDPRAANRGARPDAQPARLPRRQRQHGIAVGKQHLAVGHPDGGISECLDVTEKADFGHVGHQVKAEFHRGFLRSRPLVAASIAAGGLSANVAALARHQDGHGGNACFRS